MRLITALALMALLAGCGGTSDVAPAEADEPETQEPEAFAVRYNITGTAESVDITMRNAQGGTEQGAYKVPFSAAFAAQSGQFVYISAQNRGQSGDVTCEIRVSNDGRTWRSLQRASSSGAFVIATCDGVVP